MTFAFELQAKVNIEQCANILRHRGLDENGSVQQFIDSEVLRLDDPYIPMDTGNLRDSGPLGTTIGGGIVIYNAPYAKNQYYHGRSPGTSQHGKLRGRGWFERMKADHGKQIINSAQKKAGGK